MGLFDFLHGQTIKSEAEEYMERRNKEYARKAREYKRKEYSFNVADRLRDYLSLGEKKNSSAQTISVETSHTKATTMHESMYKSENCDTCHSASETYYASMMNVIASSVNQATRTVTVSGTIVRGRFLVGDTVTIQQNGHTTTAVIGSIICRGERLQYANSSNGKLAIIFNNTTEHIAADAAILKKNLG